MIKQTCQKYEDILPNQNYFFLSAEKHLIIICRIAKYTNFTKGDAHETIHEILFWHTFDKPDDKFQHLNKH